MDLLTTLQLAAVDAINPCSIAVQAMLLAVLLSRGRRAALLGGLLFATTVMIMYALYGLVLHALIASFYSIVRLALVALLGLMAAAELRAYFSYSPGLVSLEMPRALRPHAKALLESVNSPWMAVPVAALVSIFLLPCSSGPYIVFLGLQKTLNWGYFLLYLAVFASPFFAITFLVYLGTRPERIRAWRERHIRELHLLAGLILLILMINMLF